MARRLAFALLLAASAAFAPDARAEQADPRWSRLLRGQTVREPQKIDYGSRRFVGGVSYVLADAGASDVAALVNDVKSYGSFLPYTRRVHLVGENDGDRFIEFISGTQQLSVTYTLRFRRTEPNVLRFWLDPARPHDIPDAWGYLRWQPVRTEDGPKVLVTYGVLAELPNDFTRQLFEDKVQRALLSVLPRMAGTLHDHRLARGGSKH